MSIRQSGGREVICWCNAEMANGISYKWSGLVWFGLVWFDLIWFDLIWFDWFDCMREFGLVWFGLVWFGLVWFGLVDNGKPIRPIQFLLVGGTSDVVGMVNITG